MRLTLRNITMLILFMAFAVSVLADQLKQNRSDEIRQARLEAENIARPLFQPTAAERRKIQLYRSMIAARKPSR